MDTTTPPGATPPPGPTPPHGTPPHDAQPPQPPTTGAAFFDSVRRTGLFRSEDRWIGGVAGGLAVRLGIDPLVTRGLLAVSVLLGGVGLVLYGVAWALLPEQRDGRIHLEQAIRGEFDSGLVGAVVTFIVGLSFPDRWLPWVWWDGDGWFTGLFWVAAVGVVIALVASSRGQGTGPTTPLHPTSATPSTDGAPSPEGDPMSHDPASDPLPRTSLPASGTAPTDGGPTATGPTASFGPAGPTGPTGPTTTAYGGWTPPSTPSATLVRNRPSGPGVATVGVVTALSLLGLAALMYADRTVGLDARPWVVAAAASIVLVGLGTVVAGLRGRKSGGLGTYGVLAALVMALVILPDGTAWHWSGDGRAVGDLFHTPQSVAQAERGYSLGAGQARIDLTEVPTDDDAPVQVPISIGAGDVTVILPEDGDYRAEVRVLAGEVTWLGQQLSRSGVGRHETFESPSVAAGAEPDLELDIRVGAGQLLVLED